MSTEPRNSACERLLQQNGVTDKRIIGGVVRQSEIIGEASRTCLTFSLATPMLHVFGPHPAWPPFLQRSPGREKSSRGLRGGLP